MSSQIPVTTSGAACRFGVPRAVPHGVSSFLGHWTCPHCPVCFTFSLRTQVVVGGGGRMSPFFAFSSAWCLKCDFQWVWYPQRLIWDSVCWLTRKECQSCKGTFCINLQTSNRQSQRHGSVAEVKLELGVPQTELPSTLIASPAESATPTKV